MSIKTSFSQGRERSVRHTIRSFYTFGFAAETISAAFTFDGVEKRAI